MRWLKRLMRKDSRTRETVLWYRHAYEKDKESRWAFARLVENGGLFRPILNEEQKAAHNALVYLLENMGMTQGLNYDMLAEMMLRLPIAEDSIDKENK